MAYQFSSRQGIAVGFTAVLILFGIVILQSWLQMERTAAHSQHHGSQVLEFFTAMQGLDERSIDMERNIQQYRLARQEAFRASFEAAREQAVTLVGRLKQQQEQIPGLSLLLAEWDTILRDLSNSLDEEANPTFIGTSFSRLSELREQMRQVGQWWAADQDAMIATGLADQRRFLRLQLLFSVLLSFLIAFFIGWWMTNPVRRITDSIVRFGQGNFDENIIVTGPLDIQRLGNRLNWLLLRLRELDNFQENILRHTEHEMRARISSLENNIGLLAEEVSGSLSDSQREVVNILRANLVSLQNQADYLKMIVERVFARRSVERQNVKLRELLTHVVESQGGHPRFAEVKVCVDLLCASDAAAWVDVEKVAYVLSQIFRNSLNFAPTGSEIRLSANLEADKLILECRDRGAEVLPHDDNSHIFEPFYRGQPQLGSGTSAADSISLAVAKELTQAMEGNIQLLDTSSGAHFRVSLPCNPDI